MNKRLKRISASRPTKPLVYVICQGETEFHYFNSFNVKGKNISLKPVPRYKDPKTILSRAVQIYRKKYAELNERPEIWLVFDKDNFCNFDDTIKAAEKEGFKVAYSNISFEVWIYAHFKYSSAQDTVKDLLSKIKKHFPDYEKGKECPFEQILSNQGNAISNVKKLNKKFPSHIKPSERCPYSKIHELVERINNA